MGPQILLKHLLRFAWCVPCFCPFHQALLLLSVSALLAEGACGGRCLSGLLFHDLIGCSRRNRLNFFHTKLRFEIWQIHSHPLSRGFSISFAFEWFFTSTYNCHLRSSWDFFRLIFHLWGGRVVDWAAASSPNHINILISMYWCTTELQYRIFNRFVTQNAIFSPYWHVIYVLFPLLTSFFSFFLWPIIWIKYCILEQGLYHTTEPYLLEIFLSRPSICHLIRWFSECALTTIMCCSTQSYYILHCNLQATIWYSSAFLVLFVRSALQSTSLESGLAFGRSKHIVLMCVKTYLLGSNMSRSFLCTH
jgi:hypothetical protein